MKRDVELRYVLRVLKRMDRQFKQYNCMLDEATTARQRQALRKWRAALVAAQRSWRQRFARLNAV